MKIARMPLLTAFATIALGGWTAGLMGEPVLSLSQANALPGQIAILEVNLSATTDACGGINATLLFPRHITPIDLGPGSLLIGSDAEIYWQARPTEEGASLLTLAATSGTNAFSTGGGTLLSLRVSVAAGAAYGTYPVTFSEVAGPPPVNARHALSSADGWRSLPHTVGPGAVVVMPGATTDSNGNGIPDVWEIQYFGTVTNVTTQTDSDGDGLSDYHEYLSGTHPRDPNSCLAIEAAISAQGPTLRWYSITGAVYNVYRATDLQSPSSFTLLAPGLTATPPINVFTDHNATGQVYFYNLQKP